MMVFCINVRSEALPIVGEWCNTNHSNILIYRHCVNTNLKYILILLRRVNWAQLRIIHSFYVTTLNEGIHNARDMAQNDCTKLQKSWSASPRAIANKSDILILWDAAVHNVTPKSDALTNFIFSKVITHNWSKILTECLVLLMSFYIKVLVKPGSLLEHLLSWLLSVFLPFELFKLMAVFYLKDNILLIVNSQCHSTDTCSFNYIMKSEGYWYLRCRKNTRLWSAFQYL